MTERPMEPLVSVVLCTYNQGSLVVEALQSVLSQTYPNIQVVLVDNGSTDDTALKIAPYLNDPRIVFHGYESNGPITKRLNAAITASKGQFISLLYADDLYLPNKLKTQVEAFRNLPSTYGVVYSPGYRLNILTGERWLEKSIDKSGNVLETLLSARSQGRFINPISPLVRRQCYELHPFYEDLFVEGELHYLRVATSHRFFFVADPLVVMREHENNMGKAIRRNWANIDNLLTRLGQSATFPSSLQMALRRSQADLHRRVGWLAIRVAQDRRWARECFRRAVGEDRRQAWHPRSIAGYLLTLLPDAALRRVNALGYTLKKSKEIIVLKKDY